jgi:hypothetical protein
MTLCVRQTAFVVVLLSLFLVGNGIAQTADKIVIDGPELENCLVTVRYYKTRQIAKVVALKLSLLKGGIEETIESGFDGVEVFLQSQAVPIKLSLMAGSEELGSKNLEKPGTTTVSAGKIGRVEYTPETIELNKADTKLLEAFVTSFNDQTSTRQLVLDANQAAIDYQCLDVFNRELYKRIGSVDLSKSIKNFVGWEENAKDRMIAGVLYGQMGICGVRIMISAGKLLNLQPNCPKLVDDYFREPLETEEYVKKAERLVRLLFAGDAEAAHQLYAPQFQQQVTVDQLSQLCETVRGRYGQSLATVGLKQSQLSDYNFSQKSRFLQVDLLLNLEKDVRCIGRVTFNIPYDRNRVGKGCLAGVNINQVFQSSHPQLAKTTQVLLEQFGKPLKVDHLLGILHPDLQPISDKQAIQALLNRLSVQFKDQPPTIDFDLWTVTSFQDFVQASGSLQYAEKDCYIELHFAGDNRLLGFSFYGPALAESTMGLFNFPGSISDTAKQFWTHLLREDADSAHALLDKDFQAQFPLEEMKKQLAEPEIRPSKLKDVKVDSVRLSSQVSRPEALMTTAYLTAQFEDGDVLHVACDVGLPKNSDQAMIYDFTNEFETDFPVTSIPLADVTADGADLAIAAFRAQDPQKLLELIEPSRKQVIDQATLQAYFENFSTLAGELGAPISAARTVVYQLNGKRYRCNLFFKSAGNVELPIEVWFNRGYLERFVISHPKINDFTELVKDKTGIKRRVESFAESWFRDVNESRPFMVSGLQTEGTMGALNAMKNEFEQKNGKLTKVIIGQSTAGDGAGEIEFNVTLKGENGSREARVLVDIGAFGGLVSAVTFK